MPHHQTHKPEAHTHAAHTHAAHTHEAPKPDILHQLKGNDATAVLNISQTLKFDHVEAKGDVSPNSGGISAPSTPLGR